MKYSDHENHHFTVYNRKQDLFLGLFTPEEAKELGPQSDKYHYDLWRVQVGSLQIDLTFVLR